MTIALIVIGVCLVGIVGIAAFVYHAICTGEWLNEEIFEDEDE